MRKLTILLIVLLVPELLPAQIFTPFSTWNHAGVNGVYLQPASIADTRLKFDMSVIGFDISAGNSLYGLKRGFVTSGDLGGNFEDYKAPLAGIKNHQALIGLDVQALNFMVPLSPKSALGFTTRVRAMINIDGIDPDMFELFDQSLTDFLGQSYSINDLAFRVNTWAEAGITYAREIFDLDKHYLKAGVTFKALQPATSAYLYIENASYQVGDKNMPFEEQSSDDIWISAKGEMAIPSLFTSFDDFEDPGDLYNNLNIGKNLGFGFDFGMVYEYRPHHAKYAQSGGNTKWYRYEPSKYLFRIGVSVLDVGSMKYNSDWAQKISMRATGTDAVDDEGVVIPEDDIFNFDELRDAFGLEERPTKYDIALPTAISIQTDWRINRLFYLGVNPYIALRQKKGNKMSTHYMTSVNIAPRLEMAGFGLSVPMSYDQFKAFNVGLGLRLGPLWLGSNNLFNMLASDKLRGVNVCMALKISIHHKNKNKSGNASQATVDGAN